MTTDMKILLAHGIVLLLAWVYRASLGKLLLNSALEKSAPVQPTLVDALAQQLATPATTPTPAPAAEVKGK